MPKISVVIPTYNRSKFIIEAIDSIQSQSLSDVEILVVDDGSTDQTKKVLGEYITNGTIRYFWQSNEGECSVRNFGSQNARGEYIAFLDSDDLCVGQSLEKQAKTLQACPEIGLVHGDFEKFPDNKLINLGRRNTSWFQGQLYPQILSHWSSLINPSTVMVPAKVFQKVGFFDPKLHWGGDIDMWWRIAQSYAFAHIPDILARIRVHPGNISGNRKMEADAFQNILDRAFERDASIVPSLQKIAQGQMYTVTGLNLLGDLGKTMMPEARRRFGKAINYQPFKWKAYAGWLLSFFPHSIRHNLYKVWRKYQYPVTSPKSK